MIFEKLLSFADLGKEGFELSESDRLKDVRKIDLKMGLEDVFISDNKKESLSNKFIRLNLDFGQFEYKS